ncbi:AraC family transcriptional regulator ligand-binding domain-containing protein [Aquabacterium sp.]|uniref:AraC family transcriptional regulator ligand-binding domain-containing protein n=1 Tax=Aquabacterium sp. TaxID=1872578 RepID=UPI004037DBEF
MSKTRKVPARYVALLIQHLEEQGIDCSPPLVEAGISPESLSHVDALLPSEQVVQVTRLLTEASRGQRDLGLRIGAKVSPAQLGDLGLALLTCPTAKEALKLCARYHALVTPWSRPSFRCTRDWWGGCMRCAGTPLMSCLTT